MSANAPTATDIAWHRQRISELRQQWNNTCKVPLGYNVSYTVEQLGQCNLIEQYIQGVLMWFKEHGVSEVETKETIEQRQQSL